MESEPQENISPDAGERLTNKMLWCCTYAARLKASDVSRCQASSEVWIFTERFKIAAAEWMPMNTDGRSKQYRCGLGFALPYVSLAPKLSGLLEDYSLHLLATGQSRIEYLGPKLLPDSHPREEKRLERPRRRSLHVLQRVHLTSTRPDVNSPVYGFMIRVLTFREGIPRRSMLAVRHWDSPAIKLSFSSSVRLENKASVSSDMATVFSQHGSVARKNGHRKEKFKLGYLFSRR